MGRIDYLIGTIAVYGSMAVLLLAGKYAHEAEMFENADLLFILLAVVLCLPANVLLLLRRLHDLNQSGSFILVMILVGLIPGVGILVNLVVNILLFVLPGTKGPNKYGERPSQFSWRSV